MRRKLVLTTFFITVLIGTLGLSFEVQRASASGTIYIRADGSIDPPDAPISTVDNATYTLNGNVTSDADGIVVERDNIVLDGAGYTVQGTGTGIGTTLSGRTNVTMQNTTIKAFNYGIYLSSSNYSSVLENNITANNECGIQLSDSSYNSVSENDIIGVEGGTPTWITSEAIRLEDSSNNLINGNSVTETTGLCIYLDSSSDNILSANVLTNNDHGIGLDRSSNDTLSGNVMYGNKYNYYVYGTDLHHFIHAIDSSNLVDGKPVYYLVNRKDLVISQVTYPAIGFLAVINSTNVKIEDITLTKNAQGLVLGYTSNSRVTGNNIADNSNTGIFLLGCSNNTISGNNVTNNSDGIEIHECLNHTISGNDLSRNTNGVYLVSSYYVAILNNTVANNFFGFYLYGGSNGTISGNSITNNSKGIYLLGFSDSEFYHNNFINNTLDVDSYGLVNVWDDGYPSGGNYWISYNGTDANHDGIGDTPYIIDANNTDHYPLMAPYAIPEFPLVTILPLFMALTMLTVIKKTKATRRKS